MNAVVGMSGSGLLAACGEGFASYLVGLGYAPGSVELRLNLLRHFSRWLSAEGLEPAGCDEAVTAQFMVVRQASHVVMSSPGAVAPLWAYLRLAGVIPVPAPLPVVAPGPVDAVLVRWGDYLVGERGLGAGTVRYYRELARPLLVSRLRGDDLHLAGLDARAVSTFVRGHIPGLSVGTAKLTVTALRSLLRYLFVAGLIRERLDGVVPARAGYRDSGLPHGLAPGQVEALIAGIDLKTHTGKRDLAIVLLLARLGLRAGEVAALCLEDIDWRAATVRVSGKGGRIDVMPLPADVGAALAGHLAVARHPAAAGRGLFFGSAAPYLPLSDGGVKSVVRSAGRRAGLGAVGAHRLRHGVATATINAGASLEEVAQLLRHRHLSSTTIYAKVDLTRLRTLARPWPGAGLRDGGVR